MFMKLTMARVSSYHAWINYNNLDKIEYHVNNLPRTFYSKSRARLRHARALHNFKQGHGWIEHNYIYKTSLLNMPKRSMDLTVDTSRSLVCMLVLAPTLITKIHGKHLCKDGML